MGDSELGTQLWINHERKGPPCPERLQPVENRKSGGSWPKPRGKGGFWTSTYGANGSWLAWCMDEHWWPYGKQPHDFGCWLLDPVEANVYEIATYRDLHELVKRFPASAAPPPWESFEQSVDWEAAGHEYDGIHLTAGGQWATRMSQPLNLYGWDCESTLWFRWCFENVRRIEPAEALAANCGVST